MNTYETIGDIFKDHVIKPIAKAVFGDYEALDRLNKYMVGVYSEQARKPLMFAKRDIFDISFNDLSERVA